ncbi:serpentine type 7TM GPCR chemoreceptor srv domain-containing protein [Ditylenchus destructor]|nr:serpentine type 7TM GPCR chemoreceptor srv domain-containing protein [Ditylenchus destructor]
MIGNEPLPYIIQLSIELPFVLFHVSVTVCIAWNIWKGRAALSTGFFLIYLVQSVCDLVSYALTVVFYRMPKIQVIPDSMLAHPIGTLAVFIINWLFYLQCVFHTTIAINRYTMIVHSNGNWEKIWRGRNIRILIVFMILISMLPAIPRLWCNAKAVNHDQTCDSTNTAVGNIITPVISTLTSIVSFSIELRTFVLFHRLGEAARRKRREDFRLLVYAVCQFVGQMLMTFQTIGTVISITFKLTEMRFYTKAAHSVVIAILCLSGPLCLFSTSKVLRQKYVQFYNLRGYDATCTPIGVTLVMATNMITNVENQKSKLHLILLSKVQGYTNIAHILKDLKDEFDIDGLRLANACGHRSFATFLTSTTMQKYCRAKDDELKTTYYGIPDSRTAHIVKEMQASVDAKAQSLEAATQLRRLMTEARSSDAVQLRQCLREVGAGLVSKLVSIRNDLNEVSQNMHVPQNEGMQSRVRYGAKDAVPQCNSIVQETQTQETDHLELEEKAVQTKGPVPHEILVKLIFVNSNGNQLNLMNVKVEYDENVQKKEFVRKIASGHPSVGKCEVKSLRYYDPTFDCDIEMAQGECIMPKRNYVLVLVDKQLTGMQSRVRYGAKDAVSQCNSIVQETQAQGTVHAELTEKAVQTKGPVPHEILVKLKFVNRYGNQLNLMNVKVECDENMQVKEFVRKIANRHPSVGKCKVKSLRYFDPTFNCDIDMAQEECIVPKRNYILVLMDKRLTCEDYGIFLIVSFVAIILYFAYVKSR